MKRLLAILLIVAAVLSFVGCSDAVSTEEADALVAETMHLIRAGFYGQALERFHPTAAAILNRNPTDAIAVYVASLQAQGIDLSAEPAIRMTGYQTTTYDSSYEGAACSLMYTLTVQGVTVTLTVTVVRNSEGFGIYRFSIEKTGSLHLPLV